MFITTTGEAPGTNRFEVSGTKGKLLRENGKLIFTRNEIDSAEWSRTTHHGFKKPQSETFEVETDGENTQHTGIINNFTAHLLGREELFVDGKEGIRGVELMNAIELSGWRGGARVELPINDDEYLEELNIRRASSKFKENVVETVTDTTGTY